jgi:acylphosphatase
LTGSGGREAPRTIEIIVHGGVQGVGFRWFTQQVAEELGLHGTVANLRDGTVRIVAQGPEMALDRLQAMVRQGPPFASVTHLEVQAMPQAFLGDGFKIVH